MSTSKEVISQANTGELDPFMKGQPVSVDSSRKAWPDTVQLLNLRQTLERPQACTGPQSTNPKSRVTPPLHLQSHEAEGNQAVRISECTGTFPGLSVRLLYLRDATGPH